MLKLFNQDSASKVLETAWEDFVFGAGDTVKTAEFELSALLLIAVIEVPNFTNAVSLTVGIEDRHGKTLTSWSGLAKNATHVKVPVVDTAQWSVPLTIGTIRLTLSGAPGGAGGTTKVKFLLS